MSYKRLIDVTVNHSHISLETQLASQMTLKSSGIKKIDKLTLDACCQRNTLQSHHVAGH